LRQALAGAIPRGQAQAALRPLGLDGIDQALGGGLPAGRLHEVFAHEAQDEASAMGFAVMLAQCLTLDRGTGGAPSRQGAAADMPLPILWLREEAAQRRAGLHGPGLADLGLDPGRLILGVLPDARALLRASVDALRCVALGAVVLELGGNPPLLDLTASRRLALAAEASGVTPLLLRLSGATPGPSAAQTRWDVACAPSAPIAADAPGHSALTLGLLRQRGGPAGLDWNVEWDRDAVCFRPAAVPGTRLPLSGGGSLPSAGTAGEAGDAGWRIAV
jgi:protein ImuA